MEPSAHEGIGVVLDAAGIRTNVIDRGSGPPVVLVHGSGPGVSALANWQRTIGALEDRFRLIAPDLVGFGFTERPPSVSYTLPTWTDHLRAILDGLGLESVAIVGNSFGGAVAPAFGLAFPHRVRRLVLMGAVGLRFPITEALDLVWGYEPSREQMRKVLELLVADPAFVTDELVELRYRASLRPDAHEAYRRMFPPPRQRWVDALASPEEALAGLPTPVLVVHGRQDRVIPLSVSLRLAELLPNADLHVFGRCGHWVQLERASDFGRLLADFLEAETR